MAILLKCSSCREQLEVDDAFAGGICRCAHCGSLSQVPRQVTQLDKKGRPLTPPEMAKPVIAQPEEQAKIVIAPSRRYIAAKKRMGVAGIILTVVAIGMVVAFVILVRKQFMSGAAGAGTPAGNGTAAPAGNGTDTKAGTGAKGATTAGTKAAGKAAATTASKMPVPTRGTGAARPPANGGQEPPEETAPVKAGTLASVNPYIAKKTPHVAGLDLPGGTVAYVLNAGPGMTEAFEAACLAVVLSTRTLKDGKYVVAVWPRPATSFMGETRPAEPAAVFPAGGASPANSDADREKLKAWLAGHQPGGKRDPIPAVDAAIQRGADTLVLITGADLDAGQAKAVADRLKDKKVTPLALLVASSSMEEFPQLVKLAGDKGVKEVPGDELQNWVQEAAAER